MTSNVINFADRKILTSDFSAEEMLRKETPQEARKYFISNYFAPLVYTTWSQVEQHQPLGNVAVLHILKVGGEYSPSVLFESTAEFKNKMVTHSQNRMREAWFQARLAEVFKHTSTPEKMSAALRFAFEECFPSNYTETTTMGTAPLVASIERNRRQSDSAQSFDVKLNVLVKTRSSVRKETALLNQAVNKNSPDLLMISKKYKKMFNVFTGEWSDVCDRNEPSEWCDQCTAIYNGPASNNAYNDPDLT